MKRRGVIAQPRTRCFPKPCLYILLTVLLANALLRSRRMAAAVLKSHSDPDPKYRCPLFPSLSLSLFPVHGEATDGALEPLLRGELDKRGGGRPGE